MIAEIALPVPFLQNFDYLIPECLSVVVGTRVRVSFGQRRLIGWVVAIKSNSDYPATKLKPIESCLDTHPLLDESLLALKRWVAQYYHYPLGEVLKTAIPKSLRTGSSTVLTETTAWRAMQPETALSARAYRQRELLRFITQHSPCSEDQCLKAGFSRALLRQLVERAAIAAVPPASAASASEGTAKTPVLNAEQTQAVTAICQAMGHYQGFLLEGITGSGKTEVYLQTMQHFLQAGWQCLVLIPEIGLTPQTVARFQERFSYPIGSLHSAMSDGERAQTWLKAQAGSLPIIIGTRSAVFTPLPRLGLIIVDEEHDSSFKQQDSLRYSARDISVKRAHSLHIPIVLGSATPSLETLYNALHGRYQHLLLTARAGGAKLPTFHLLDLRQQRLQNGLAPGLLQHMRQHLQHGRQVLLFINRRGYAPLLICQACGWVAACQQCDAKLTLHLSDGNLQCHHCAAQHPLPEQCPACQHTSLIRLGMGTERIEESLRKLFPNIAITRIDRDATRRKGSLATLLERVNTGRRQILIGTQMLAKGHHFPNVTLVGILQADNGFLSHDFRGSERIGQLITQVAGRAGRERIPGAVVIQTYQPDNPLLRTLIQQGYAAFSRALLQERRLAALPPYGHLALLHAEAKTPQLAQSLLQELKASLPETHKNHCLGPILHPLAKKKGRYRGQLLIQASHRSTLQQLLDEISNEVQRLKQAHRTKLILEVDPLEVL